jgi:hypothetical protein
LCINYCAKEEKRCECNNKLFTFFFTYFIIILTFVDFIITGGWGSLEYGSEVAGQVVGGRWKPIHYWMRKSLFTDVLIACGVDGTLGSSLWYIPF